ncbi:hypothetical protein [Acidovorax sp.]|uniref:hypothetical protein n=1 Tax=Acidovorax sp. TaxID=1872122 RepID=UPI00391F05CF
MKIHLISSLAKKFGAVPIEMHVSSPMQMFRGLECNVDGWEAEMRSLAQAEEVMRIVVGNGTDDGYRNVNPNFLNAPFDEDVTDVYIVASVNGGGIEIGAFTFMGLQGYAAVAAYVVFNIAVAVVVGAITQALAPSPDSSGGSERPEERGSFIFNGPVNTTVQGAPVPLVYGECLTGSVVMSAGIYVEEMIS